MSDREIIVRQIPVYLSRHTENLPDPCGAFLSWEKGERARSKDGTNFTIRDGELKWHDNAPLIDSARGWGYWVIEVMVDGEEKHICVSPAAILFEEE